MGGGGHYYDTAVANNIEIKCNDASWHATNCYMIRSMLKNTRNRMT